ncbi:pyrroline-5-carboxylate reductase [Haloplasma contractile]|uniref:Pyrroline-5-carboxylate reductase n=1 Tax=Haloplasma contractile SSD-17B TaxID=1033810 RepID=U2FFA1_9MOLU|nr:pyrroline-5-carboxylate reductase [Haloplasma contractile]ERJ11590.1 Pyrroline-5-carboxylate reductase protein [Haloplasma contractile SSD-17B]
MKEQTIGFIGCGNMAKAIIGGIVKSQLISSDRIIASNRSEEALESVKKLYDIRTTTDNKMVAKEADLIVLAVKPYVYKTVINEIKDLVNKHQIIINIAAGVSIKQTEAMFGKKLKIVRTMPNTPALVSEGMTSISPNELMIQEEIDDVVAIFESFGKAEVISEDLIHAVIPVSGSSPAYVYQFIEAMADAAVLQGMPRKKAYKFASQAVLGAAKMVLETGLHPGELKDQVCSPGGTTIEAVTTLEEEGFRKAVIRAMNTCSEKSRRMTEDNDE